MNIADNTARLLRQCNELARCIGVETPIRVLLVGDSLDYYATFKTMLSNVGGASYVVDAVFDAYSAEVAIRAGRHDIYVMELHLNGGGVVDIVRKLQDGGSHFPFVVLTGAAGDDRVAMGRDCMMWMNKRDYASPVELDRALRYSMKNWLTRCGGRDGALPPTSVPLAA